MEAMKAGHYGKDTVAILINGPITLHIEVDWQDPGAEVDSSLITQEDINVIKGEQEVLCDWIGNKAKEFCNIGIVVDVEEDNIEKSITFRLQASPEYRAY